MARIAAVYARVSTAGQAGPDRESLPSQITACRKRASEDGFEVPDSYVFQEAVSGTRSEDERPEFLRLIELAEAGGFERVYFLKTDRFGRDDATVATALKRLSAAGVTYYSLLEPQLDNPLIRGLMIGMAQAEALEIKRRTLPAKLKKRDAGHWVSGTIPYGFVRGPDQSLDVEPATAQVVREIFDWSIQGRGRIWVTRTLNGRGTPPPMVHVKLPGNDRPRRLRTSDFSGSWEKIEDWMSREDADYVSGKRPIWSHDNVFKLLQKTIYVGELHGRSMRINPAPIIDQRTFERARQATKSRNMRGAGVRETKLLTGMLRCASCGRAYIYHQGGHKTDFYICHGRRSGNDCVSPGLRMYDANNKVTDAVRNYLSTRLSMLDFESFIAETRAKTFNGTQVELEAVQSALKDATVRRRALSEALVAATAAGVNAESLPEITTSLAAVTSEIETASRKQRVLSTELEQQRRFKEESEDIAVRAASDAYEATSLFPHGDHPAALTTEETRQLFHMLGVRCQAQPDKSITVELDDSDAALAAVVQHLGARALSSVSFERSLVDEHGWTPFVNTQ